MCRVLRWGKDEQAKRLKTALPTLYWLHRMSVPNKGLNDGSTHPFSSLSLDQIHNDSVSCLQGSLIEFPTLLSITEAQKREGDREFPTLYFRQVASFAIFEHKMTVPSSRVYCCSTVVVEAK
jgi:hypothetical protein